MIPDVTRWIAEAFAAALADTLDSMVDERPQAGHSPGGDLPCGDYAIRWAQTLSCMQDPAIEVVVPYKTWKTLGIRTLRAVGINEINDDSARGTFFEILNQSFSSLATALSARLGREIASVSGGESAQPLATGGDRVTVQFAMDDELELLLALAPGLVALLEAAPGQSQSVEPPAEILPPMVSKTFDLLLDVELPVSISFGRTQLPIKDVLKLTTGSIVELNRAVTEPVEIIVNNCVIARGEVVVVEGNYGVRIQQIASRADRLRTGAGQNLRPALP